MSSPWPREVKRAVDAAAATRAVRRCGGEPLGLMSMPEGEVFAAVALAGAVCLSLDCRWSAVVRGWGLHARGPRSLVEIQ